MTTVKKTFFTTILSLIISLVAILYIYGVLTATYFGEGGVEMTFSDLPFWYQEVLYLSIPILFLVYAFFLYLRVSAARLVATIVFILLSVIFFYMAVTFASIYFNIEFFVSLNEKVLGINRYSASKGLPIAIMIPSLLGGIFSVVVAKLNSRSVKAEFGVNV